MSSLNRHHKVYAGKGGEHPGALVLRSQRAFLPFQPAHGGVVVQRHDEAVPQRPRLLEVVDVAAVQEVEAARW